MPRKGWTSFPTPSGWFEVIRGPRPKSEEWPRHQQWHSWSKGWWPAVSEASKPRVQRRWQRSTVPRASPDEVKAAARSRIERLQSALDALGETESAEARGLQAALKGAERSAKERHLAIQVEECQAFIKRSQNRIARLEEERAREKQELDAAMGRMAKFQEEMAKSIPVVPIVPGPTQQVKIPELFSEVERLRSRVAEMEMEREEARKKRSRSLSVPSPDLVGSPDLALQALHGQHTGQHRERGGSWRPSSVEGALWLRVPTGSAHWLEGSLIPCTSSRRMGCKRSSSWGCSKPRS